jgi:hypothetical protein
MYIYYVVNMCNFMFQMSVNIMYRVIILDYLYVSKLEYSYIYVNIYLKDRLTATVNGEPLPTELPKSTSDSSLAQGSDPLAGESEADYVTRQRYSIYVNAVKD